MTTQISSQERKQQTTLNMDSTMQFDSYFHPGLLPIKDLVDDIRSPFPDFHYPNNENDLHGTDEELDTAIFHVYHNPYDGIYKWLQTDEKMALPTDLGPDISTYTSTVTGQTQDKASETHCKNNKDIQYNRNDYDKYNSSNNNKTDADNNNEENSNNKDNSKNDNDKNNNGNDKNHKENDNKDNISRNSKGSMGTCDSSSRQKQEHKLKRTVLFKRKSQSAMLSTARLAAVLKSKNTPVSEKAQVSTILVNIPKEINGKTEAERLKEERYQKKLASNRAAAKRARIRRDNYMSELEKQLESLENEIQKLNDRAETLKREISCDI